jgi:hypothetical protein
MNKYLSSVSLALLLLGVSLSGTAAERPIAGSFEGGELIVAGVADTALSPAVIANNIGEDVGAYGVSGIISGTLSGTVKGTGQALTGVGRVFVGIMDVITAPVRNSAYNRHSPGSLR